MSEKLPEYSVSYTDRGNKRCEVLRVNHSTRGILVVYGSTYKSYRFIDDSGIIKLTRKNSTEHVATCNGIVQIHKLPHHAVLHNVIMSENTRAMRENATATRYNLAQEVQYSNVDRIVNNMLEYIEKL